jgi:hypothetical protein
MGRRIRLGELGSQMERQTARAEPHQVRVEIVLRWDEFPHLGDARG